MANKKLLGIVFSFFFSIVIHAQDVKLSIKSYYQNGFEALEKDIAKGIRNKILLEKDEYYFFSIKLISKDSIFVSEINNKESENANYLKKSISKTSRSWLRDNNSNIEKVIPIFLLKDQESKIYLNSKSNTFWSGNVIHCILFPPVVFNFYN